jgi:hypothetical protein
MSNDVKARYACFLVYPESAPEDWKQKLKKSHGSYAISPLHTPDDEDAKPHYHVIYKHGAVVTLSAMLRVIPSDVPANGHVEICSAPRNYQRYLIHLDDPEKQQFKDGAGAIEVLNGFPLDLTRDYSKAELQGFRSEIYSLIREYDMTEYAELLDYLMDNGEVDLLDYASNHTILYNTYLTSRRNSATPDEEH